MLVRIFQTNEKRTGPSVPVAATLAYAPELPTRTTPTIITRRTRAGGGGGGGGCCTVAPPSLRVFCILEALANSNAVAKTLLFFLPTAVNSCDERSSFAPLDIFQRQHPFPSHETRRCTRLLQSIAVKLAH